ARRIGTRCPEKGQWAEVAAVFPSRTCVIASAPRKQPIHQKPLMSKPDLLPLLHRIAEALDRLAPAAVAANDLTAANAFIWHADREWLEPVPTVNRVDIGLLRGIDRVRDILRDNTERFAAGLPANN